MFTARYGLSPYIKQTRSVFKGLTKADGDATVLRTVVFKWHKASKEGWENVEDDPHLRRPNSSTNDQIVEVVCAVMAKHHQLSASMIAEETVNHAFYKDVLERLRKRVQWVQRDIADNWVLHHNNAPAHTALSIREFLAKKTFPYFQILTTAQI